MLIRILISSLLALVYAYSSLAVDGIHLTKKDGIQVTGQLIETYVDRWFYEPPRVDDDKYYLVYHSEKLTLVADKDILHIEKTELDENEFEKFLLRKGIVLESALVKSASVLTAHEGHHKLEKMFGNFAWDLGILGPDQRQFRGLGTELEDYYIFGAEVYSPVKGKIVGAVSDKFDNKPSPDFSNNVSGLESNYLLIEVEHPYYFSIVHFKQNSIIPTVGDWVEVGDSLGRVGNSGVSYIPHLHFTLYFYAQEHDRFISIPIPNSIY